MYKTVQVPLDLDKSTKAKLLEYRYHQTYFYNIGVELALDAIEADEPIPSDWTANAYLKEMKTEEWHPPVLFQRAACHQGLEAIRKHRSRRGTLETSIEHLKRDLEKAVKAGNAENVEKYTRKLAITEEKLERLLAKGTNRFYRTRKAQDNDRSRAVVLEETARLINQDDNGDYWGVRLVGGCELPLLKPVRVEEEWKLVGSVQIVETTKKITRKTTLEQRQYRVHLQFKAEDPPTQMPASEEEVLGVDVGVAISMAVSDGRNFYAADVDDLEEEIKKTQTRLARCSKGSRQWKKCKRKLKRLHQRKANRTDNTENQNIARLLNPTEPHLNVPKAIAAEDLKVRNMKASAKGTINTPGKNVAQKRGLNRRIHQARLGILLEKMEAGSRKRGISFYKVSPAGTSQHCHICQQKGIRESQAVFRCAVCGESNADFNASCNMRRRGWEECGRGGRIAILRDGETDQASGALRGGGRARQQKASVDNQLVNPRI